MIVNDSTIHYIERMVDRRHVGESDMSVIRYVKSKLAKGAWEQVENKKRVLSAIIRRHHKNQNLYHDVMTGGIKYMRRKNPVEKVSIEGMEFNVENGRIVSPGKFEGERTYVPYFWQAFLNGFADRDDGKVLGFDVTAEDKKLFPTLKKRRTVRIVESDTGFVREI